MFCPKCGKGEQAPDSYCRNCGEFLTDFSAKSHLLNMLLGGASTRAQVRFSLIVNMVTGAAATALIGFLKGHYDALYEKTGEYPPRVIYYVYVFLGLILVWQLLGLIVNGRLRKKLDAEKKKALPAAATGAGASVVGEATTRRSLPPGQASANGPESVTQQTTKRLDKVPRRKGDSA